MELLPQSCYSVTNTDCSLCNRSRRDGKTLRRERERERPHVHFRSQVVCLYVHVISNRKVLAGVVEDDQWRFSHNPLCLFLVLQFTERQRAKGSQRE